MSIERFRMTGEGLGWIASSQEGEVATGDGFPQMGAAKTIFNRQQGAVMVIQESPFMPGVFLTVGDWTFNLWKEGVPEPLFSSPYSSRYLMTGCWSPTRPGLIMIARDDGVLQAWDLLGRNSVTEPTDSVPINNTPLTSLAFSLNKSSVKSPQVLAVGDEAGTLHILQLPLQLWRPVPNEKALVEGMLEREVSRVAYCKSRLDIREVELTAKAAEETKRAAAQAAAVKDAPAAVGTGADDDDAPQDRNAERERALREVELVALEAEYLKSEAGFREILGLANEEEEVEE